MKPGKPPAPARPADRDAIDAALEAEREALKALFPLPPARPPHRGGGARAARRVGHGLAVAAMVAGVLLWIDPAWRTERHASAVGERREIALADGSRMTLDTATAVDVAWHLRSRRVVLHHGQARFEVSPARYRPFEVAAGDMVARVVGTVFDVRRHAGRVAVTVLEGRVAVRSAPGQAAVELGAGEQLAGDGVMAEAPRRIDPAAAAAWSEGRLVFRNTPLAEALDELQRHRSGRIRMHGAEVGALQVSGVFETERTEQILDLLPAILPVSVTRQADGSVDVRRR